MKVTPRLAPRDAFLPKPRPRRLPAHLPPRQKLMTKLIASTAVALAVAISTAQAQVSPYDARAWAEYSYQQQLTQAQYQTGQWYIAGANGTKGGYWPGDCIPVEGYMTKFFSQLIGYDHVHNPWGFINFFKNYGKNAADVTSTYAYPGSEGIVCVSFIGGVVPFIGTLPRCLEFEREAAEIARQKYGYGR